MTQDIEAFWIEEDIQPDGHASLTLVGELDLANADKLSTRLTALGHAALDVRLDLARLTFIDSSGLRAIIGGIVEARQQQWSLTVGREVSDQVRRVFELSGLIAHVWPEPD